VLGQFFKGGDLFHHDLISNRLQERMECCHAILNSETTFGQAVSDKELLTVMESLKVNPPKETSTFFSKTEITAFNNAQLL
jgi:membrane-bound lytic murein transglycosylase B